LKSIKESLRLQQHDKDSASKSDAAERDRLTAVLDKLKAENTKERTKVDEIGKLKALICSRIEKIVQDNDIEVDKIDRLDNRMV